MKFDDELVLYLVGLAFASGAIALLVSIDLRRGSFSLGKVIRSPLYWTLLAVFLWAVFARPSGVGMVLFSLALIPYLLLLFLLDPDFFWYSLVILLAGWLYCRTQKTVIGKAIAEWSKPLVFGMAVVGAIFLVASHWVPRAHWVWLFRLEELGLHVHDVLDSILPKSIWAKQLTLFAVLSLDLAIPVLRRWTARFTKTMKGLKTTASVLTVIVSLTLFGHGQAAALGQKISVEKHARLEPDSTALAMITISARIEQNSEAEAAAAHLWLDAVASGVKADLLVPHYFQDEYVRLQPEKQRIGPLIDARIKELNEAISKEHSGPSS